VFDTHVHIWNGEASVRAYEAQLAGELGMIVLFDNANIVPGDSQDLFNLAVNTPGTKFVFAQRTAFSMRRRASC